MIGGRIRFFILCRLLIGLTTVFMWQGRAGQPTVNLVFFVEKKFTVRFRFSHDGRLSIM